MNTYPIGTPGVPWGDDEKTSWLARQRIRRSYDEEVLTPLKSHCQSRKNFLRCQQYGEIVQASRTYPLMAILSRNFSNHHPNVLITGGVHGYETSGVQGTLQFIDNRLTGFAAQFNFVIAPCVSPWGYETINRWNPGAIDPNRSFHADGKAEESSLLIQFLSTLGLPFDAHIDLHETTDTDNTEFRPALAARDARPQKVWSIPDGFYCVGDTLKPVPEFQKAIIESVAEITHIAEADENDQLIGVPIEQLGVINYPTKKLGLCAGVTNAPFVTTTEVYPDSPRINSNICNQAQVAAIVGALNYLIDARPL